MSEKRHNTAEQARLNFFSKSDCMLPPPGEYVSLPYLTELRQLCYTMIGRIDDEERKSYPYEAGDEDDEEEPGSGG